MCVFGESQAPSLPKILLQGNTIRGNVAKSLGAEAAGGGVFLGVTGDVTIQENLFESNISTTLWGWQLGAGLAIYDEDITNHGRKVIHHNQFVNNQVGGGLNISRGGGIWIYGTTATISCNVITGNTAYGTSSNVDGGGIYAYASVFLIDNNIVARNVSTTAGGGVDVYGTTQAGAEQVIVNNTITGNRAVYGGGLCVGGGASVISLNNILWGDTAQNGSEIYVGGATADVHFSTIQGGWPSGTGNIDDDPQFVPADPKFTLSSSSPCFGAGTDSLQIGGVWYRAPGSDIGGAMRPNPAGSHPDIGAVESPRAIGLNQPALSLTPASFDFHNVHPGTTSDTLAVTVENRASDAVDITGLSLVRSEFGFSPGPALPLRVSSFGSIPLKMVFRPALAGVTLVDTLVLTASDLSQSRPVVRLSGRGSGAIQRAVDGTLNGIAATPLGPQFFSLNKSTGSAQLMASFSPVPSAGLNAFTNRRSDSTLYAAIASLGGTDIYRFSSAFGDVEFAGTVPLGNVTAMAISQSDALYLVSAEGKLYRGGIGSSDTVLVGSTGHVLTGLAFNPASGVLWGALHDSLFTLDTQTGTATRRGANSWVAPHSSITFNSLGTMYGLYSPWLVAIDKVTGMARDIGLTGVPELLAIAMKGDEPTSVNEAEPQVSLTWRLEQNYPNPFNPSTTIRYGLPQRSQVTLTVYNTLGQHVSTLDKADQEAGYHEVRFDGTGLASGVYYYRIQAGPLIETRKLLILR